ncbi:hypothetical protein BJ170DRAFT_368701 [Xylariales sp. AK1849]|nr:hypothetical protein BJ170DRAFT_368701 [Xylariales sp. AK1849]
MDKMGSRLTFQEIMRLEPLSSSGLKNDGAGTGRYMSVRAAWLPKSDLNESDEVPSVVKATLGSHRGAFGAHVYSQCGLAAAKALRRSQLVQGVEADQHYIHIRSIPYVAAMCKRGAK